jgi:hypothetical protein
LRNKQIFLGLVAVSLFVGTALPAEAQKVFGINRNVDSVLTLLSRKADVDTNYITRSQSKWTVIGRFNVSGARIKAKGMENGQHFESQLSADYKSVLCIGVNYRGLAVSLALNPAKLLGKYRDYELNFQSYSPRMGCDISYQDAHNFSGWHEMEGVRRELTTSDDMFKLRTLNVNGYYVFSPRRFSYPAAFAHSYIQRRSAGSFLLAASGQGQHGQVNNEGQKVDFKMTHIAIGAGYGYNYVPARSWLFHISFLPTYIVYSHSSFTVGDSHIPLRHHFPEGIITTRAAIVKQIGSNMFAGFSGVYNLTRVGNEDQLSILNQKWRTRIYFGFRL